MPDDHLSAVQELEALARVDTVAARDKFLEIYSSKPDSRREFLSAVSKTRYSRLRQAIARAAVRLGSPSDIRAVLVAWRSVESDEFARAAYEDALTRPPQRERRKHRRLDELPDVSRTFRYLADRLRHRVLNAIPRAGISVDRLKRAIYELGDQHKTALLPLVDDLRDSIARVERAIQIDDDVQQFESRRLDLIVWLGRYLAKYGAQWDGISVEVRTEIAVCEIVAVEYLLETIFRNLLDNARRHAGPIPVVTIGIRIVGEFVEVNVDDTGPGLTAGQASAAFDLPLGQQFVGRGFLEVRDAARRLGGEADTQPRNSSAGFCVRLRIPLEHT
jgi:signal transduction histidine kinase